MFLKTIPFFLFGLAGSSLLAQSPTFSWAKALYGATLSAPVSAEFSDLDIDGAGNTYVTGEFHTRLDLGGGIVLEETDAAFFLAKYSPDGVPQWARKIRQQSAPSGANFNNSGKIDVDGAGNVYWAGEYKAAALDFGNGITVTRACNNNCIEGFVTKIDGNGNVLFAKGLRAAIGETFSLKGIVSDQEGNHYVTGQFFGTELWLQGGGNIGGLESPGYYLGKYKANGNSEWTTFLNPGSGLVIPQSIDISPDGQRIVVAGEFSDAAVNFGNGAAIAAGTGNNRFVVWYSPTSHAQGAGALTSSAQIELLSIQVDEQYRVWAPCEFRGSLSWKGTSLGSNATAASNQAVVVLQPNTAAISPVFENDGNYYPASSIAVGANGAFYTAGSIDQTLNLPGLGSFSDQGCADLFLIGGANQQYQWAKSVGQAGCEEHYVVNRHALLEANAAGDLYLCGKFTNSAKLDNLALSGNGLWVGKLSAAMVPVETLENTTAGLRIYPNPAADELTIAVAAPQTALIQIRNTTAQILFSGTLEHASASISVKEWPAGVYVVSCMDQSGHLIQSTRVVIR